jgi:hypothetical protein
VSVLTARPVVPGNHVLAQEVTQRLDSNEAAPDAGIHVARSLTSNPEKIGATGYEQHYQR